MIIRQREKVSAQRISVPLKPFLILFSVLYALLLLLVVVEGGFPAGIGLPALIAQTLVTPLFLILFLPIALHPIALGVVLVPVTVILWKYRVPNILIALIAGVMLISFAVSVPVRVGMDEISKYRDSGGEDIGIRYGYPWRFVEQMPYGRNREPFTSVISTPREHATAVLWPRLFLAWFFWSMVAYILLALVEKHGFRQDSPNAN